MRNQTVKRAAGEDLAGETTHKTFQLILLFLLKTPNKKYAQTLTYLLVLPSEEFIRCHRGKASSVLS